MSSEAAPPEKQKRRNRCRSKKIEARQLPKLTFINVDSEGELVECQLETTQHSMVSFKFSRILDQPDEIAQNLVSVPCACSKTRGTYCSSMFFLVWC